MIKDQVAGDDKQKPLEVIILPDEFPRLPDLDKHLLYHILGYIPIIQIKPTEMIYNIEKASLSPSFNDFIICLSSI